MDNDITVFYIDAKRSSRDDVTQLPVGWYWQRRFCDPQGPFYTEEDARNDAPKRGEPRKDEAALWAEVAVKATQDVIELEKALEACIEGLWRAKQMLSAVYESDPSHDRKKAVERAQEAETAARKALLKVRG